ncbi:DNA protection during starvation protein [Dermatophilus congolensis]|uniref:DNA protection during starvation protein n=2 Tax=Dermatophilus congolensis TaxID=1863 RepID=A0AA46BPQ4_9MICO|nr:DNA starvation/stationary phase protection protein [Dermatophilus congolensis]STD13920.1 DNA protection during starvation protein [Dermatophilus congolensis]
MQVSLYVVRAGRWRLVAQVSVDYEEDGMADVKSGYTVPGMNEGESEKVIEVLQKRLAAYNDLQLTLKHVHWNVVGRNFIGVHEMLDPQIELVRGWADEVAERIATMGGSPAGRPGDIVKNRDWEDYSLGRDTTLAHLAALDKVYEGVVSSNRAAISTVGEIDPISEDMLIGHSAELEKFHWFIRAHLEDTDGQLVTRGTNSEEEAADAAR